MARTGIEIGLDVRSECVGCGSDRELEGRLIAQGERLTVVDGSTACECGETRIRVTVDVEEAEAGEGSGDAERAEDPRHSTDRDPR